MASAADTHPGRTDFDVADRLAILNLVNSYSEGYDLDNFDEWLKLFTDDIVCKVKLGNQPEGTYAGDEFRKFLRDYRTYSADSNIVPRHFISNLSVKQQSSKLAKVVAYICFVRGDQNTLHTPGVKEQPVTGTARYTFVTRKDAGDGVWRISEYAIDYDQNEM